MTKSKLAESRFHFARKLETMLNPFTLHQLPKLLRSTRTVVRPRRPVHRGVAATEFAIVAPVFLLLVIGILELGRALMVQQVLINASRVGARQAITLGATTSEVQTAVAEYALSVAVPGVTVNVSPSPSSASAGDAISVTASVPYSDVSWLPAPWFLGGTTLTAQSQMRKEGFE
jgi:Flp pilus assembly protein TadG